MSGDVKPIPDGYHAITAYLCVKGAAEAIDFYKNAFGAKEIMRMPGPGGSVGHAELEIGGSRIMLADEFPQMGFQGPRAFGGTPVHLYLYVADVDATLERATGAGATLKRPAADQFYGDRSGSVEDPFGHSWHVATHVEDVPPDELKRRAEAMGKEHGSC